MSNRGAPAVYPKPEDLILAVENYFEWVKGEFKITGPTDKEWIREPEPVTITGLALFLGFESRQSIYDYEKKGEFSYIIKNARLRVENAYEKNLYGDKPTGSIFALKNMGWMDHNRTELTGADGKDLNYNVTLDLGGNTKHTIEPVSGQEGG
jgi:hypothetical protein